MCLRRLENRCQSLVSRLPKLNSADMVATMRSTLMAMMPITPRATCPITLQSIAARFIASLLSLRVLLHAPWASECRNDHKSDTSAECVITGVPKSRKLPPLPRAPLASTRSGRQSISDSQPTSFQLAEFSLPYLPPNIHIPRGAKFFWTQERAEFHFLKPQVKAR